MPSSPITVPVPSPESSLLACLGRVPDPRDPRGVRYPLAGLLAVAVTAVLAGSRSFAAIGQWAGALDVASLADLGLDQAPAESNLRKLFARLDTAALDLQLAVYTWTRTRQMQNRRVIAIDGKTVRGARTATAAAPHLIAALDHGTGVVLGQVAVPAKTNEIPAARDLLAGFDPADLLGSVITLDAMHTQTDTAQVITGAGADYVLTVKANQPGLHDRQEAALGTGARTPRDPDRQGPPGHPHHQSHRRPGLDRLHRSSPGRPAAPHPHCQGQEGRRGGLPDHLRHRPGRATGDPGRLGPGPLAHRSAP